ncbi:MAG: hypothetical protein ABSC53_03425 [Bacteroidota bacterium]|jgi:hypothetical protein
MKPELFSIIYKTRHARCNRPLALSDYRIKNNKDLKKIQKESKPLSLFCSNCMEDVEPTLVDVFLTEGLSVRPFVENLPIEMFNETKL